MQFLPQTYTVKEERKNNMNEEEIYGQPMQGVEQPPLMAEVKEAQMHFSKLGFMYLLGTLIVFGVQYGVLRLLYLLKPEWLVNDNLYFLFMMVPMYAIAMPIMMLLIKTVPGKKIEKHKMNAGQMILAFFMGYAILYVSNIIGTFITLFIGILKGSAVENELTEIITGISPWLTLFFVVICAPVMEELIFRKLLVERTVKYGEGVAVLLSGLMFGLFHGNLNQFAYAFTIGMFFAFIFVKTGKIIYTIILHMIINFMGSEVSMWVLEKSGIDRILETEGDMNAMMQVTMEILPQIFIVMLYFFLLIASVLTGIILLIVMRKRFTCRPGEVVLPKGKRFKTVIVNLGMGIFLILWLILIVVQLFL